MWKINVLMCFYMAVVLGCWQVLVSSDGSKSAKLAYLSVQWLQRVANVLGAYIDVTYTISFLNRTDSSSNSISSSSSQGC